MIDLLLVICATLWAVIGDAVSVVVSLIVVATVAGSIGICMACGIWLLLYQLASGGIRRPPD